MRSSEMLSEFVRESLSSGRDPADVRQALTAAGWSGGEIDTALSGWGLAPDLPPVPRPSAYVSAREALLYGLLFLSISVVAWHLGLLGFLLIDHYMADPGESFSGSATALRWSVAALLTFCPLFYLLHRRTSRDTASDPGRRRSLVRKWLAMISLLLSWLVLLGDLVLVVFTFLDGGMTANYLSKSLLVAAIGGLIWLYYRDELDA